MFKINKLTPDSFQNSVLNWFDQSGRHDLPWQKDKSPYRVWVSEIMLQQTQVTTVIPFYLRFMERFPILNDLASATEDEVLHYWTGLGYYSRARNLQRAARIILQDFNGIFPDSLFELEKLPGIGRSTAGAILSIAFEKRAAILDGNVKRVFARLLGITQWPGEKKITEALWETVENYAPFMRTADYTQALMDLGATVCIRGKPHCSRCPLQKYCVAHAQGIEKNLPISKPRKAIPTRNATLLILQKGHHILLEKRPSTGVWGGLWSLPEMTAEISSKEIQQFCRRHFQYSIGGITLLESFRHTFSHFHLDISPVLVTITKTSSKIMEDTRQIWYNLKQPATIGLPAPIKSLLSKLP